MKSFILAILFILCSFVHGFFEIPNILKIGKTYSYCLAFECCNDQYVTADFYKLKSNLQEKLYGQHLALEVVVDALKAHWKDGKSQKALTLSFHGLTGSGKNYVTKFITESIYKEGVKSAYVHNFIGRIHFPLETRVEEYKMNLQNWIKGNASKCEYSLFIFDEVDKMPPGVLNAITPMIDYHEYVDKVNYKKTVFIFMSNTGGTLIRDHLIYLWKNGVKRNDIALKDFEQMITKGVFNEKGGFHHSDTIKHNLIDHYIPFFPMQQEHVDLCIRDQFALRGITNPEPEHIEEVMSSVQWGPPLINLFSTTGCKRLSQKVALVTQKYGLRNNKDNSEL